MIRQLNATIQVTSKIASHRSFHKAGAAFSQDYNTPTDKHMEATPLHFEATHWDSNNY